MSTDSLMLFSGLILLLLHVGWNLHHTFDQWNKTEVTVIDFGDHVMKKHLTSIIVSPFLSFSL